VVVAEQGVVGDRRVCVRGGHRPRRRVSTAARGPLAHGGHAGRWAHRPAAGPTSHL